MGPEHGAMLNEGHRCTRCGGNLRWNPITEDLRCLLCRRSAELQAESIYTQFFLSRREPRLPTPTSASAEACHAA